MVDMRGSLGNKKGFKFQKMLTDNINEDNVNFPGLLSKELDEQVFCESIGTDSRDKIDNIVIDQVTGVELRISAKCPARLGSIQMSSFAISRQFRYLESVTGQVLPEYFRNFCHAYFGRPEYSDWMEANTACGAETSKLDWKSETRRQRTLLDKFPPSLLEEVKSYFDNNSDLKKALTEMHLISGFTTDRKADCQIYHPAPSENDIDFTSNNFYYVDLYAVYEECQNWELELGNSTINFGPLNLKVRGGGGKACKPTSEVYHIPQCFSGINKFKEYLGGTGAFIKGSFPEVIRHSFERKKII